MLVWWDIKRSAPCSAFQSGVGVSEKAGLHAGISMLGDGSIIVTGGDDAAKTSIYDPATGAWLPYQQMNIPRGYQVPLMPVSLYP